jgi:hypothetical protein
MIDVYGFAFGLRKRRPGIPGRRLKKRIISGAIV